MEYKDLQNKVALVTGGGTGIGLAIARKLCSLQVRTIISGRREEVLARACRELGEYAAYRVSDLADLAGIPAFVKQIDNDFGRLGVLVNNAGIHIKKAALELTDEEYQRVVQINQTAVFALTREVARSMRAGGSGSVVMLSSMAAHYGIPRVLAYTAAKSAIEGMTRALCVELAPYGIRVNCIAPGFIATAMSAKSLDNDPQRKERVLARTPLGRLGKPEDVARAVAFLASDAAAFITGVVLPVDGGNAIGF